jgi:hypothetical protein
MGLDGVEIVMKVEEAFGIEIKNEEAEKIRTPRQLIELVATKVAVAAGTSHCATRRVFHRLRSTMMASLSLPRSVIRPEASLKKLIPRRQRRRLWRELKQRTGLTEWPELTPGFALVVLTGFGGLLAAFTTVSAWMSVYRWPAIACFWVFFWLVGLWLTKPLHCTVPSQCQTVGSMAEHLALYHHRAFAGEPPVWTQADVARTVRGIVGDQLGLKEDFSDDADFVHDLGMD